MTAPLAVVLLFALAAPAAAAPCPVPMFDKTWKTEIPFPDSDPDCALVKVLLPDFVRLRDKAGFTSAQLPLIVLKNEEFNAFFSSVEKKIGVNTGFLHGKRDVYTALSIFAHEVGHAVQDRGPEGAERDKVYAEILKLHESSPFAAGQKWNEFKRRYEGQADGVAQQLLAEAGYPPGTARLGTGLGFKCSVDLYSSNTHPAGGRRIADASFAEHYLTRIAKARAAVTGVRFEGSSADPGETAPFVPKVKLTDYDHYGKLKLGRFVATDLQLPPPPPASSPQELKKDAEMRAFWERAVVKPFAAAVDEVSQNPSTTNRVLEACGTPGSATLAKDEGLTAWMVRVARAEFLD